MNAEDKTWPRIWSLYDVDLHFMHSSSIKVRIWDEINLVSELAKLSGLLMDLQIIEKDLDKLSVYDKRVSQLLSELLQEHENLFEKEAQLKNLQNGKTFNSC